MELLERKLVFQNKVMMKWAFHKVRFDSEIKTDIQARSYMCNPVLGYLVQTIQSALSHTGWFCPEGER
jgi:hypothetical protein